MGVKRSLQSTWDKIMSRLGRSSVSRSLSNPSALTSAKNRGIEWLYLLVFLLLAAGVLNAATNAATPGIASEIIVPNPSIQSVTETFILLFGYIVGALGMYTMYLSGRQTIRARSAEMFFVFGIIAIAVALTLGYYVVISK
jgi:hypothetical protein